MRVVGLILSLMIVLFCGGAAADKLGKLPVKIVTQVGHFEGVNSISHSLDGKWVISGSDDKTIKIWEEATGRLVRTLKGHSSGINSVSFSPDGRIIISGSGDKTVKLWDIYTGRLIRTLVHSKAKYGGVQTVAFSPDGKKIISGSHDKTIKLWKTETGQLIRTFKGHSHLVASIAFSPDGKKIISGSYDKTIKIWKTTTGDLIQTLKGHSDLVNSIACSSNGQWIVSGSDDDTVKLWSIDTGHLVHTFKGHSRNVNAVSFSEDNKRIISGSNDDTIKYWDSYSGKLLRTFDGPSTWIKSVSFSRDGRSIITGSLSNIAKKWDISTGKLIRKFGSYSGSINAISYTKNGQWLAAGSRDKTVNIFNLKTGSLVHSFNEHSGSIKSIAFSSDGKILATGSRDKTIQLRDIKTGHLIRTFKDVSNVILSLAFSQNGQRIVSNGRDENAYIIDINTGNIAHTLKGHSRGVRSIDFSPDGAIIAIGSYDDSIKIWNASTGKLVKKLEGEHLNTLSLFFLPNGKKIIGSTLSNGLILWDVKTGKLVRKIHQKSSFSAISDDRTKIATWYYDQTIKLIDIRNNRIIQNFNENVGRVNSITFANNGEHIISGGEDSTVKVWNTKTGTLVATLLTNTKGEWIVLTPEGYFNASKNGAELLHIVRGLDIFPISYAYNALYRPDLVREKLAGDPKGLMKAAAIKLDLDKIVKSGMAPKVEIVSPKTEENLDDDRLKVKVQITPSSGGIGRVEWRVNGRVLGVSEPRLEHINHDENKKCDKQDDSKHEFGRIGNINCAQIIAQKVWLDPGKNIIEVIAYNKANLIASTPAHIMVHWDGASSKIPPKLWVLAVGVNDYWDSRLKLKFAVPDATAIGNAMFDAAKGIYDKVNIKLLLNKDVTTSGLKKIFDELGKKIAPRDVFVFFIAGHGKTLNGKYYFIPQDFRYSNENSITKLGIGQDKWQKYFSKISARKSIFLYDTCESGSMTGSRVIARGMERVAALEKLTRAMGRTVLSASTDDTPALEGFGGHGVFTYALLNGLAHADVNRNNLIEVTELASHVDTLVPKISFKAFGYRQIPQMNLQGSNFPLTRQTISVAPQKGSVTVISLKPTHVVLQTSDVFLEFDGKGQVVTKLKPGTLVTLIHSKRGWALVAKEGKKIGFVANTTLIPVQ